MIRTFLAASLLFSATAYACPDGNCDKANCPMPTASTAATAAPALPAGTQGSLDVVGMKCGHCADQVKTALMKVQGVNGANVDVAAGKATVSFDDKKTNLDALVKAVNATGAFTAKVTPPAASH